ncbi:Transient receptor potential channel pyrexia [Camponotus floridanus]|uniref:Transient receptor potential channel pyrexia n=1 Tax=Camponotus floridanus TaxID=104421 RepID=E2AV81_CAMFO|nr:Transient receptor potential channel pyrexia [Camponotus floridanus]
MSGSAYSNSEGSLESIICHASQDESRNETQKQPWSKEEIEVALSKLPEGETALCVIPTLHGDALQKVLEEFQSVTINKSEDRKHSTSLPTDEIKQKTTVVDENRAANITIRGQLLAKWPNTCLLISSWLGHVEIVKALLEKGVPVSTRDNDGSNSEGSLESIICHASQDESRNETQKQPWSKEEIEVALSKLPEGETALCVIPTLHGDALQKVLEEFQSVTINKSEDRKHSTSLPTDEIKQKTTVVDENRAANITIRGQLLAKWPNTCLLISSWLGHVEIVKALLEKGVPVSTRDNDGRTPLHLAACTMSTKIVKELLKHGADPRKWDFEKKYTPLHCAAAAGCVATVTCLIKSGANVNAGRSPLYYAVLNNAVNCVEALLQAGASPNNPQFYGRMPLHVAAILGNVHCIRLLLDHRADVTMETENTKSTPLHLAAENGNAKCTRLLLKAGSKTETKNSSGQTAMHLATVAQSVKTIDMLISADAKVNAEDNEGRTPLHAAVSSARNSSAVVKILIKVCKLKFL